MRRWLALLLVLFLAGPANPAVVYFTGFETGDASEVVSLGASSSVQGGTVLSGAYSLKQASASTSLFAGLTGATQIGIRQRFQIHTAAVLYLAQFFNPGTATVFGNVGTQADGILAWNPSSTPDFCGQSISNSVGTTPVSLDTPHLLYLVVDLAAGGALQVWLDGSLEIDTTHPTVCTQSAISYLVSGRAAPDELYYDDVLIQTGDTTQPPLGQVIARQGTEGTPTYTGGTKASCTCASAAGETCIGTCANNSACCDWSQTPVGTTENVTVTGTSSVAGKQSVLVASFAATQTGHGSETLDTANGTVNACQTLTIAKRGSGSAPSNTCMGASTDLYCLIRRLNGADSWTGMALTTGDLAYNDCCWTPGANSYLTSAEMGIAHGVGTGRVITAEDLWMMCDYANTTTTTTTTVIPGGLRRIYRSHEDGPPVFAELE
jgi:hypothetical protein